MALKPLNLGTQSNPARFAQDGDAKFINCYLEPTGPEGKAPAIVYPFEGFKRLGASDQAGRVRGSIATDTHVYAVIGGNIVECSVFGEVRTIGTCPAAGLVSFARNIVKQIALVSGGNVYRIEGGEVYLENTLTELSPRTVTFIDGYFVFALGNGQFHWTEPNSFNYIATNFATAEADPDGLKCALKYRRELWLFGSDTIEAWKSTGDADGAFRRLGGGVIENGMSAECAAAEVKSNLVWIDEDNTVQISGGDFNSVAISVSGIARDIEDLVNKETLRIWDYPMSGHRFIVVQSDEWTHVYNLTTKLWNTRTSEGLNRWRIADTVKLGNKIIGIGYDDGVFYELSRNYHDEDGTPLHMVIRTPPQAQWPGRVTYNSVHLNMLTNPPAADGVTVQQVGMRFSDDGGGSWSPVFFADWYGGEFAESTVQWHGLGQSQEQGRMFEFTIPASVPRSIRGASADIQVDM